MLSNLWIEGLSHQQGAYKKRIRKGTSGFFFLRAQANRKKRHALNRELITVIISSIKVQKFPELSGRVPHRFRECRSGTTVFTGDSGNSSKGSVFSPRLFND
jgi:hypothetical protein